MTEEIKTESGELTAIPRPYEENAYKYAELYRGLKEPSGGYANIVDAYIAGAIKETKELEKRCNELFFQVNEQMEQIEKMKCCSNCMSEGSETCLHCENKKLWQMKE